MPKDLNLHRMKLKYLEMALARTNGNRMATARLLGVSFRWVRALVGKWGLAEKWPPKKHYGKRETRP